MDSVDEVQNNRINPTRARQRRLIQVVFVLVVVPGLAVGGNVVAGDTVPKLSIFPAPSGQANWTAPDPGEPQCVEAEHSGFHYVRSGLIWSRRWNFNNLGCSIS